MRPAGWRWFCAWAVAGGLVFLSLLTGFSIGVFILPFAALAVWFVARTARAWPELFGVGTGAGAVCLLVAALNREYNPCPEGPITVPPGETSYSCGGLDPLPWLVAGIVLGLAGAAAYAGGRRIGPPRLRLRTPLSTGEKVFLAFVLVFAGLSLLTLFGTVTSGSGGGGVEIERARHVSGP
jgi:hypothetical protein